MREISRAALSRPASSMEWELMRVIIPKRYPTFWWIKRVFWSWNNKRLTLSDNKKRNWSRGWCLKGLNLFQNHQNIFYLKAQARIEDIFLHSNVVWLHTKCLNFSQKLTKIPKGWSKTNKKSLQKTRIPRTRPFLYQVSLWSLKLPKRSW